MAPARARARQCAGHGLHRARRVGFSDFGCYGSEIETPNVDRLARAAPGTPIPCHCHVFADAGQHAHRPQRTCRRHGHDRRMGRRFPSIAGRSATRRHLAENLRENAYGTMAVGKWRLTPMKEVSAAGPFGNWPLGRGFDRWYGFQGALTDQLNRSSTGNGRPRAHAQGLSPQRRPGDPVDPPCRDHRVAAPDQPYFLYLAFGACHWPHHVPQRSSTSTKAGMPGWDDIQKPRYARQKAWASSRQRQKCCGQPGCRPGTTSRRRNAASLSARRKSMPDSSITPTSRSAAFRLPGSARHADNTIIVLISDNGASPEGGQLGSMSLSTCARPSLQRTRDPRATRGISSKTWVGRTPFRITRPAGHRSATHRSSGTR